MTVALDQYPIHEPSSADYQTLVANCQRSFQAEGVVLLPGFVIPEAVSSIVAEGRDLLAKAHFCRNDHNVYLNEGDAGLGPSHPQNRPVTTTVGSIANDYLAPTGALQQLYDRADLTSFIADVVQVTRLFRSEDPLGAVTINVFRPGDGHGWHFDESRFSVTLMAQSAEHGGHFEYVQDLRQEQNGLGNIAAIGRVLDEAAGSQRRLVFEAGTLSIFAGHHTMHRVTPVRGCRHRFVPVLTYSESPGYCNSAEVRELFWGRAS